MDNRVFVDYLSFDNQIKEYVLKRKYQERNSQNLLDWCDEYMSYPERMKLVAMGITAFLAERNNGYEKSFRTYLHDKRPFGTSLFYQKYFDIRLNLLRDSDRLNPFEGEWKQDNVLIQIHIENEAKLFDESSLFFDEVMEYEISIIDTIKKASLGYPEWVKINHLKDEVQNPKPKVLKPVKVFPEYLLHVKRELLAEKLKAEFSTETGKGIRLMIESLQAIEPKLISIENRQRKAIYTALKIFFNRDIGTRQSIFDYKFDRITDEIDFSAIRLKLNFILKSINKTK